MKNLSFVAAFALVGLAFVSCEKEVTGIDNTYSVPNAVLLTSFYANQLSNNTQSFTVDATTGGMITGAHGATVTIAPGSLFHNSTTVVTGNVDITLVEIYDRGTMVTMNKATRGYLPNDSLSTLVSGGEYYLKISQNGQDVLAPTGVAVTLPADSTGGPDGSMAVFNGVFDGDDLNWDLEPAANVDVIQDTAGGTHYLIMDQSWGWTNVDRFYSFAGPKTLLRAQMPTGFTPANCELFLTYDGEPTALASLDVFENGYFSEHYGQIPIGLAVHFIAVAIIDGELYYAIQAATIEEDHIEQIASSQFHATTQAELVEIINDLP